MSEKKCAGDNGIRIFPLQPRKPQ